MSLQIRATELKFDAQVDTYIVPAQALAEHYVKDDSEVGAWMLGMFFADNEMIVSQIIPIESTNDVVDAITDMNARSMMMGMAFDKQRGLDPENHARMCLTVLTVGFPDFGMKALEDMAERINTNENNVQDHTEFEQLRVMHLERNGQAIVVRDTLTTASAEIAEVGEA